MPLRFFGSFCQRSPVHCSARGGLNEWIDDLSEMVPKVDEHRNRA